MWNDIDFLSSAGFRCKAYFKPGGRGTVIFLHGWGDHAGRYLAAASRFSREGYSVLIPDFPGHGRSEGPVARVDDLMVLERDLLALLKQCHLQDPVFLCGHSMGGCLAFHLAVRYPDWFDGVIFNSAALTINPRIPRWKRFTSRILGRLIPHQKIAYLKSEKMMSSLPAEQQCYNADPLIYHGKIEARTGLALMQANQWVSRHMAGLKLPFLALQSQADDLVNPEGPERLARQTNHPYNRLEWFNDCRHDLLHDRHADQVIAAMLGWLSELVDSKQTDPVSTAA